MGETTLVEFRAGGRLKTWRHSDGGSVSRKHGDRYTTLVIAPLVLKDGDRVKMNDKDLAWCRATYPQNFKAVSEEAEKTAGDGEESEA